MTNYKPNFYLDAHANFQLGTYLDRVDELRYGMRFVSSLHIADHYWNYAYGFNATPPEIPEAIQEVRHNAHSINRQCVIYVTPDTNPPTLGELLVAQQEEEELWMTLSPEEWKPAQGASLEITRLPSSSPTDDFIYVFRDAYGGVPGSPGYVELPPEYTEALSKCLPREGVVVAHLIGHSRSNSIQQPVAIASIFLKPPLAGLYNVGTSHAARLQGFASAISSAAIEHAFSAGCSTIFLQTQPNSPVEKLYRGLGFKREFLGRYLLL